MGIGGTGQYYSGFYTDFCEKTCRLPLWIATGDPMTPVERIRAALLQSQVKAPVAEVPLPQPVERVEVTRPAVTVREDILARLLRSDTNGIVTEPHELGRQ